LLIDAIKLKNNFNLILLNSEKYENIYKLTSQLITWASITLLMGWAEVNTDAF